MSKFRQGAKIVAGAAVLAAVLTVGVAGVAGAAAPTGVGDPQPYQLSSSQYKVGIDPLDYQYVTAACGTGYYFDNSMVLTDGWTPTVTTHGTDIYLAGWDTTGHQLGQTSAGAPEYQAYRIELGNHSWSSDHDGSFTWTCDPLPA